MVVFGIYILMTMIFFSLGKAASKSEKYYEETQIDKKYLK